MAFASMEWWAYPFAARYDLCTGRDVCLEFHDDATDLSAADHHVEKDLGIGRIDLEWRRVAALHRPCGQLSTGKGVPHVVLRRISRHEVCNVSALDRDDLLGLPAQRFLTKKLELSVKTSML